MGHFRNAEQQTHLPFPTSPQGLRVIKGYFINISQSSTYILHKLVVLLRVITLMLAPHAFSSPTLPSFDENARFQRLGFQGKIFFDDFID